MKIYLYALLWLVPHHLLALNIHSVQLSQSSNYTLQLSLNTEAVELYYYDSYNYSISGNTITLNVFFIAGFGSTIAYLNNNFSIPNLHSQQYVLVLRIFYTDSAHSFKQLTDSRRLVFAMPLGRKTDRPKDVRIVEVDSRTGQVVLSDCAEGVAVFDLTGRRLEHQTAGNTIYLGTNAHGLYLIRNDSWNPKCLKVLLQP